MKLINKDRLPNIEVKATDGQEYLLLPYKHLRDVPTVEAILIPEGATNGDMIKAMFPNAEIDYHEKSDLVDSHVTVFIKGCDTCQDYSYDWWNAPYRK